MNYKKGTQTRGCMKSVMRYVSQMSKTLWDGQQLVSGIGCQPETAFDEFLSTKLLHHKDGGVMLYHMVQSFPKGADVDPRTAHEAARRLAEYFEGCEVLVCTHVDREHIHSHCIINSVNFETGRKVHMADEQIQELRIRNDQICEELGLPKFQKDEQRQSRGMSNAEYYTADRGESWKFELMRVIDECMRCAGNREEFLILLRSEGYDATWTDSRKNITYTTPENVRCRDNKLFDQTLLRSSMEAYFDMGGCEYLESRIDATEYGELLPTVDDAVCGLISILDAMNTGDNDRFHLETLHHSKQEIRRILERGGKIDRTVEYAVDDEEEEYEQYHGFSMRM